jgi:hypothetical protein
MSASNINAGGGQPSGKTENNTVLTVFLELLGLGILTVAAGFSDQFGKIIIIIMVCWIVIFAITNQTMISKFSALLGKG